MRLESSMWNWPPKTAVGICLPAGFGSRAPKRPRVCHEQRTWASAFSLPKQLHCAHQHARALPHTRNYGFPMCVDLYGPVGESCAKLPGSGNINVTYHRCACRISRFPIKNSNQIHTQKHMKDVTGYFWSQILVFNHHIYTL